MNSLLGQSLSDPVELMQHAMNLAKQGSATTHPNPRVGCVIVADDKVVGEGWHAFAGEAHAERLALDQAGSLARGATAYVTLEPCCHQGRTPPCTDALINAGINKVVAAMSDPNALVSGGGFESLRAAGIDVEVGLLEQEAMWMNRGFVRRMKQQRPWVVLKTAATLDGKTAAFDGESQWITGATARADVHVLRSTCSALVTGIGTVLADDPQMTVRHETSETERQPLRVVLDSQLRIPLEARIIGDDGQLVVFTLSENHSKIAQLTELGVEVIQHPPNNSHKLDLQAVLVDLAKWQCNEVLIESGQVLAGAFLEKGLVDELVLYYAGSILGERGLNMFQFDQPLAFADRLQYRITDVSQYDADIRVNAVSDVSMSDINLEPSSCLLA